MAEFEAREMEEEQQKTTRDSTDPTPQPLLDVSEFGKWSFYRAVIAEFVATLLFLYITIATLVGSKQSSKVTCDGVGQLGTAWSFGGLTFVLVYCITGLSGGHINPAVTFGMMLARKLPVTRGAVYIVAQCAGAVCGAALAKGEETSLLYGANGGGLNMVYSGYSKTKGLLAEVLGTFVLVYTVFSAADPRRHARDSHVPILAPLPIGFAVFVVHLATMHITGTGINPARSFGAALVYNHRQAWHDHWIFWVGPIVGSAMAVLYHQHILRASRFETGVASRSIPIM